MNRHRREQDRAQARADAARRQAAQPRGFASPPCAMHEVDPAYMGLPVEEPMRRQRKRRAVKAATVTPAAPEDEQGR